MKQPYNAFAIGDRVTCYEEQEAYYSNYGGNPTLIFSPGMVGTVGAIKVPYVTHRTDRPNDAYFLCVDFIDSSGKEQRVGLSYRNVRKLQPNELAQL